MRNSLWKEICTLESIFENKYLEIFLSSYSFIFFNVYYLFTLKIWRILDLPKNLPINVSRREGQLSSLLKLWHASNSNKLAIINYWPQGTEKFTSWMSINTHLHNRWVRLKKNHCDFSVLTAVLCGESSSCFKASSARSVTWFTSKECALNWTFKSILSQGLNQSCKK